MSPASAALAGAAHWSHRRRWSLRLRSPATESTWELLARLSLRGEAASSPLCGAATIHWTRQHQTQRYSTIRKTYPDDNRNTDPYNFESGYRSSRKIVYEVVV
uniref:Secreted protein n=1 Tax=Macrostomum lignano TaxID=282301 RepID=A0A1I8ICW6_9PLAT